MKRFLPLILCIVLLFTTIPAVAEPTVIYNGIITRRYENSTTSVYPEMNKESTPIKFMSPGEPIKITAVYPAWVEILVGKKVGYVLRNRIDVTSTVDPVHTPPYPTTVCTCYALIDRTVDVKAEKDHDSETLSTLTDGAKIALLGMEDGWAKLIWCQHNTPMYGYIDSRELSEIYYTAPIPEMADTETPISVFTSFYTNNPDRIINLSICCKYISVTLGSKKTMNFNDMVKPFTAERGYKPAMVLVNDGTTDSLGGGSCQVSSTLWDTLLQLPGITVTYRVAHGANGASYLPHGMDAASGTDYSNLIFRNDYSFPIRIEASVHDFALFIAIYREN